MLTRRQQQALEFIRAYIARHAHAPSLAEIAAGMGVASVSLAHRYTQALADAGHIKLRPGRKRAIEVAEQKRPAHILPLIGKIAAGQPIEALPGADEIDLSVFFTGPGRFVLRVQGDSMVEDGILDGDMVIVEKRATANNGEIVVALIDGNDATLKRFHLNRDGSVTLRPANAALPPLRYSAKRVQIQGVVVGQMRSYR
ncbi:MAG: transcriptional repressor LexA [Gammaproteobacteria bacterium]|nr:transcriptional repressor LexA [Gammaproteobacteria bacterium]